MYCGNCGRKIDDHAPFCKYCGHENPDGNNPDGKNSGGKTSGGKIPDRKYPEYPADQPGRSPIPGKNKKYLWILVPVLLLLIILVFVIVIKRDDIMNKLFPGQTIITDDSSDTADKDQDNGDSYVDWHDDNSDSVQGEDELEKYAKIFSYDYGDSYIGYLSHHEDDDSYEYSIEESFLDKYLGKRVFDYDGDGDEELLIVETDEQYQLFLTMYEYDGEHVSFSDTVNLTQSYGSGTFTVPICSTGFSKANPGILDCYIYDHDGVNIAVQASGAESLIADGVEINFVDFTYQDGKFHEEMSYYNAGSDFEDDDSLYADDTAQFENIGINIENFLSLMYRGMTTEQGVKHALEVVHCRQYYNDIAAHQAEFMDSYFERLRTSYYVFSKEKELRVDLNQEVMASENRTCYEYSKSDTPQDVYRKFLTHGDYYDQIGKYSTLAYAIRDINGDGTPDLMLLKDYNQGYGLTDGTTLKGNVYFYRLNHAGDKVKYVGNLDTFAENNEYDSADTELYYSEDKGALAVCSTGAGSELFSFFTVSKARVIPSSTYATEDELVSVGAIDLKKIVFTDISYMAGIDDQTNAGLVEYTQIQDSGGE